MPKRSEFEKMVDLVAESFKTKIEQDDQLSKKDTSTLVVALDVARQLIKDIHNIGEYVRSKKGREW